jgi:methylated-DNA-protein-cysteine methyltransferase-like protein
LPLLKSSNLATKKSTEKLRSVLPSGKKDASFFEQVYEVARQIPKGRVTSYGAIASYLGTKMSARMVGWAMNGAHTMQDIPAHRVVNRNGMLSGKMHFSTPTQMEELLKKEKVIVVDDVIVDFEKKFWNPSVELSLDL